MDTDLPDSQHEISRRGGRLSQAMSRKGLNAPALPPADISETHQTRIRPIFLIVQACVAFGIVLAAALAMQAMVADREAPPQRPVREQTFTIQIIEAKRDTHQPQISIFGEIGAANVVEVRAELAAPVVEIGSSLERGAVIEQGELIGRLDPFDFETAIADANSALIEANARLAEGDSRLSALATELTTAKAQQELAERDLARAEELIQRGSITQQTLDQRQQTLLQREAAVQGAVNSRQTEIARRDQLIAAVERAEIQLKRAKRNLQKTEIRAPITGVIENEALSPGQLVSNNQVITTVSELRSFEANFTLSDDQYGRLTQGSGRIVGTPVQVLWRIGARTVPFDAEISRVAPTIAAERGGVSAFARLNELPVETDLRPGAFVEIVLDDRAYDNVIRIPESALYDEQRVYIVEDERLKSVDATPLAFDGDNVLIQADLEDGVQIMTTRIAEAGDGLKVRINSAEAPERRRNNRNGSGS